jgi:hypothetical protein
MFTFDIFRLGKWLGFWSVIGTLCHLGIPLPSTISKMPTQDPKDRRKKTRAKFSYISNFVSTFHAIAAVIINARVILYEGILFGNPVSPDE